MFTLISIELYKIFRKWRTYIGFIAIGVLVPIIHIAMVYEGKNTIDFMTRNIQQSFVFVGNLLNTYLISYIVLNSLTVHIPFLITLVGGDLLAGEATAGTYRIMLTRPVTREKFATAKFFAGVIYTNLLILWLAVMSLVLGYFIFGVGELLIIKSDVIIIFKQNDVLWRFLGAYGYASLGMTVVASLAFLFSSLVENAIGPIVSTMAVIIVFVIISAINVDLLQSIRPYLFTNYISSWQLFFDDPVDFTEIFKSAGILIVHILIFFIATLIIFRRKDILT
ncbi:MAG: ABC transporter permease [Ignavibacterium album]|jgi:ABC-2 type transport system permease protein|uniref:ABC transporter permease n=1 Tax=Ignavibacterium album TaxID=591197 RepID=UPI0026EFD985|nr:ABC transporter permease subunit [Ignavibacterium album]MCX8105500.1 ABC transporter permease [Ignavibacterium album]